MAPDSPPPDTRSALLNAAIHLFGHKGYAQSSTRELAARAGTNVASIAYHFGSKDGLRRACADEVAARMGRVVEIPEADTPEAAARALEHMLRRVVAFITAAPGASDLVAFMLRELADPGEVADRVYAAFLEPRHRLLCALWEQATGQPAESETTKLAVFALIGQVLYFRIGQPYVLKRTGWAAVGEAEAARIADTLSANLHAMIERART